MCIRDRARELSKLKPFVAEGPCRVQRPGWFRQSSRPAPPPGEDTPHTWEHSDEVQVPFLQQVMRGFALVPIIFGSVDPAEVARVLADKLDDQTLILASSDLSHYYPYDRAKELDKKCVDAICRLDVDAMTDQEACGKDPILCLMHIARQKGWVAKQLDYRNSGDTAGDKSGVVGYAAIAFEARALASYTKEERKALLELARRSLVEVVTNGRLPTVDPANLPPRCAEEKGCFVTLTKKGALRGCIGNILPSGPLWKAVMENARNAAVRDYRFPPVQKEELRDIEIEISVLTVPQTLKFDSPEDLIRKLRPHKDGVVLELGLRSATYLPQVWEQLPDPVQFLSNLSMKAGAGPDDWRKPGTKVLTYQVEAFKENE
ncbi:MAG: AmmeMemoRadiSam system protein A, partial [Verrucomicrobiae bacterium]|nr:AmmeMemoRadiSam system protein A [Verrucomicrobiae bacterium]